MKRRKVAMLMAMMMTASSLSGSYASAASLEELETTAEEIAVQSRETESETAEQTTETEPAAQEVVVLSETEAPVETEPVQAETESTESETVEETAESETAAPETEAPETESAAAESEISETEPAASEVETEAPAETEPASETEAVTETETETPQTEEATEAPESETAATEPEIAVFSGEEAEEEEPVDYFVDFGYSYGGREESFLFYGDRSSALTLTLNTEGLNGLEDYEVEWTVIQDGNEANDLTCVGLSKEETSITLTPVEGFQEEGHWLDVEAKVLKDGNEITATGTHLDVIPTELTLSDCFPDRVLLPGGGYTVEKECDVWIRDPEHIWGDSVPLQITGVRVSDPEEIFWYNEDEDGRYHFTAKSVEDLKIGSADIFLSYIGANDENQDIEGEWQFSLTASTEKYSVNYGYSTKDSWMICGSEQDIFTSVYREWCDLDGNYGDGEFSDYTVEVGTDYDTELVEVTVDEDQKILHVKANEKEGGTNIPVRYKVGDQEIAEETVWVSVSRNGYMLAPDSLTDESGEAINPLKGEILDLTAFADEFKVYHLQYNEETGEVEKTEEPEENIRYEVRYNDEVWSRIDDSDEEYGLPVLKRMEDWQTDIQITAEKNYADPDSGEEDWGYAAGQNYTFASVYYYLNFEYSYEGDCLFYGDRSEPLTLTLQSEDLDRLKDYEIVWEVLQDGMDADEAADLTCATTTAEGNTLTLTPAEGFSEQGHYLYVGAKIIKGETVVAQEYRRIEVIPTENSLKNHLSDQVLFPGWNHTIEPEYQIWVKDPKHPYGTELPVRITSVNISDPDQVFNCDKDENGAIVAEEDGFYRLWVSNDENDLRFGEAKLTVAYEYAGEEEEDLQGEVTVSLVVAGENYNVNYEYVQYDGSMVYGSEMDIRTSVLHQWYDQDEGYAIGEDFTAYTVEIAEDKTYDSELVTVSVAEDQQTIHVKANTKEGGTNIPIYYKVGDEKIGESSIWVYVSQQNYYLESDYPGNSAVNPLIGETIDLASWNFKLYRLRYNEESKEVEKIEIPEEDIDYYWVSYDENMWNRLESSEGSRGLAKLQRKRSYGGSITVYAGYDGSDIGKSYWFDGFDYQAELEYSYGGPENSRVYTDAPLTLTVKTEPEIENQEGISVEWDVFVYDENGERQAPECMGWTIADDARSITVTGREYCEGQWFQVEAIVKAYDEEIARCEYGIEVRGESYYFTGMENMRAYLFIGEKAGPFFTRDTNGKIWMETYLENAQYPDGKRTKVQVTGIEEEGNELLQIINNEEGIRILQKDKTGQTSMVFLLADEDGNEVPSISCPVFVQDDLISIIDIEIERESGAGNCLLPGETLKLRPVLARQFAGEDGEIQQEPLEASDYHIVYTDYDASVIQVDADGTVHTVGRGDSWVTVQVLDEEGQEITSNGLNITVAGKYYQLRTEKEGYQVLAPGESLKDQLTPYVYSLSKPEGEETEDGTFMIQQILNDVEGVDVSISETGLLSVSLDKNTTLRKGSIQSMEIIVEYRDADGNYLADTNYVVVLCNHDGKVIERKAATCTEDGYETYECEQCGLTWKETLAAIGHTAVTDAAVKATCETAGKTEGSHCSTCGKVLKEQKVIPATGHTAVTDAAVKATCETAGKTEGSHCSTCGKVLKVQTTIPATGHTAVTDAGVKATCETAGKTEGSHCSTCGKVLKAQTEIAATGHTWSTWKTTSAATVFAAAEQERSCTVCKKTETRTSGKKLTPVLKFSSTTVNLKTLQKTTKVKVKTMAKGDSVVSWKSSNTKIVKVTGKKTGTCTLTAGSISGTAKITVKLASGKTGRITVKVKKVTPTKITGVPTKKTVKKGKSFTLKPVLGPTGAVGTITYSTSNKKVATVTSKGKVAGKKKGTAVITVKCGKLVKKCVVTVK